MDGGAWWAAVHGVAKSWTQLSDFTFTFHFHALEKETPLFICRAPNKESGQLVLRKPELPEAFQEKIFVFF